MLAAVAVVGIAAVVFLLAGPGIGRTISGELWLYQAKGTGIPNFETAEGTIPVECWGVNGFNDVENGGQVRLLDELGSVLATASLGEAHLDIDMFGDGAFCGFRFEFRSVRDAEFYTVAMGRRGELSYSRAQLEQAEWSVKLTLGP